MNHEWKNLPAIVKIVVLCVIAATRIRGGTRRFNLLGLEFYAYQHANGMAWGIDGSNGNLARGIR